MAPFVNKPAMSGYEEHVVKLISQIEFGEYIAADDIALANYYFNEHGFNVHEQKIGVIPLFWSIEKPKRREVILNPNIWIMKPRYILCFAYHYPMVDAVENLKIRENYNLVSNKGGVLLFERRYSF